MRILFFSNEFPGPHHPTKGVFNLRMCEALAARHDVRVIAPVPWTEWLRAGSTVTLHNPRLDVAYRTYYFPPRVLLSERGTFMWWAMRRYLLSVSRTWRPDVVLAYWTHPDGEVALRYGAAIGAPVVQMVGGSDVLLLQEDARRWSAIKRVLNSVDAVITIGQHLAEEVIRTGVPAGRVHSIYRPVDPARFCHGDRAAARRHLGMPDDLRVILWTGRFVDVKAVDVLLNAMAHLRRRMTHVQLFLVGTGTQEKALRQQAERLGLVDSVRFVGEVSHEALGDWYRAANTTVLPSLSEGIPNVLLESMACGVPFVASSVGGIPEIADPALDILTPAGDATALADALEIQLSRTPASRRQVTPGSPELFLRRMEEIFAGITAAGPTRLEVV